MDNARPYRIANYIAALSSHHPSKSIMQLMNNAASEVGLGISNITDENLEEGLMRMVEKMALQKV